jgi:hypothetical protein
MQDPYDSFIEDKFDEFYRQILNCLLLNNFFWGVWALALLSEHEYCKPGIFNYDFAHARCLFYQKFKQTIDDLDTN